MSGLRATLRASLMMLGGYPPAPLDPYNINAALAERKAARPARRAAAERGRKRGAA